MPRLDRLIARTLGVSRKQATRLCRHGHVHAEDGEALRDPAHQLAPSELPRTLQVRGRPVTLRTRYHLLQHKPRGVVTALRDRVHPTAYDLITSDPDVPLARDLRPVGRLDKETSGLLLWTTEGTLLHRVTHPRYRVPRVYQAALARPWSEPPRDGSLVLERDGHRPAIEALRSIGEDERHPALHVPKDTACLATITLRSGKFHEVRRIFAALGSHVLGLCRTSYGPIALPRTLPPGGHEFIDLHPIFAGIHPVPRAPAEPTTPPSEPEPREERV